METHQYVSSVGVSTAREAQATAAATTAFANAHVVRPFLSHAQASLLVELFSPMQLIFEPAVLWAHPIQRTIHNFLEAYVRRKAGPCLEVGAHPRSINENGAVLHRCFLPPDGRDRQRWQDCPRRGPANNIRRALLADRPATDLSFCVRGFENCRFHAEVGIALYSLHELHPRQVAVAMRRHGMSTLYAVLHLPAEALLPPGVYQSGPYVARNQDDRVIVTYEGDTSAGYNHRRSCIRAWIKCTRVGGCCSLVIERVRAIGCHFVLRLTAVTTAVPMPYTPYPKSQVVYVRSLFSAGGTPGLFDYPCPSSRSTFHAVPVSIWDRLMLFGVTLDDEAFCCSRLMTYLRGISFKVTVGTIVANEGWTTDEYALTAVVTAAYLTICHQRWIRTQGISMGVKRLAREHQQGLLFRLGEWLLGKFCGAKESFVPGRQLKFYRQCQQWLSAGFYLDVRDLCFDREYPCACSGPLHKAKRVCGCVASKLKRLCGCFVKDVLDDYAESCEDLSDEFRDPEPDVYEPSGLDNWTVRAIAQELKLACDEAAARGSRLAAWPRVMPEFFLGPFLVFSGTPDLLAPLGSHVYGPYWADGPKYPLELPSPEEPPPSGSGCSPDYANPIPTHNGHMPGSPRFWEASPTASVLSSHTSLRSASLPSLPETPARNPPVPRTARQLIVALPDGSEVYEGDLFTSTCHWLVNAANASHQPGGGICGLFYAKYPESFDQSKHRHPCGSVAAYTLHPRPIIHAVAPDYRLAQDYQRLCAAYKECAYRSEPAAFCLLGTGIYRVPVPESLRAWWEYHLPGDELYLTSDAARWLRANLDQFPAAPGPSSSMRAVPSRTPEEHGRPPSPGVGLAERDSADLESPPRPQSRLCLSAVGLPSDVSRVLLITPGLANTANLALQLDAAGPYGKYMTKAHISPGSVKYRYVAGVPGSGKSTAVRRCDVDVVVTPTAALKQQWGARGFRVYTQHVGMVHAPGARVVIDEAPAFPPHLLLYYMQQASSVLLLGDPNQIPAIDFEQKGLVPAMDLKLEPTEWRLKTYRCPRDICYLIAADYPGIHTVSSVVRSLEFGGRPCGQLLVFTQAAKAMYPGSITVHEAQGSTFNTTTIIATNDSRGLLVTSRAHAIVALTRHREKCVVIDAPGLLREIGISDAVLSNFYLTNPVDVQARPAAVERAELRPTEDDLSAIPPAPPDVALYQMSEAFGHRPTEVRAVVPCCPPLEQGKLYMPMNLSGREEVVTLALTDAVHCRMAAPAHRLAVLSTLVGRYGKETKLWHEDVAVVRESLRLFVPDLSRVKVTSCELAELVEAMIARGQDGSLVLNLDFMDRAVTRITFFQKDCNKFTTDETVAHGKVGQGISAWSKTLVALFGPWFRAIEKAIVDRLPEWLFYGDGYAPDQFESAVSGAKFCQVFENDFSEFDSTQNNFSLGLECVLMAEAGMPEWMWKLYHLVRSAWVLQAPQESLRGRWKKHSGEPGTLLWNTVWNMAVISHCYVFQGLKLAAFKGDDSVVCCTLYHQHPRAAQLITGCGLKLKTSFSDVGAYAGWLLGRGCGAVPDVVRFLGRLTEKNWGPGQDRQDELRQAVCDFLDRIRNVTALTCLLATKYYSLEPGLALNIVAGLRSIKEGVMTLTEFRQSVLKVGLKE
uniref:Polyprotein n=1 Tax=Rocahepevirus ratti TaxID=1678145 RepID=A0A2P1MBQ6_9VIRU|nr:polyprotein [Rocahepevirus ratti]